MKKTILGLTISMVLLATVFLAASCGNDSDQANSMSEMRNENVQHDGDAKTEARKTDKRSAFSAERNDRTAEIIDAYEQIEEGLNAEDSGKAAHGAKSMIAALDKFDTSSLSGDQQKKYAEIYESAKEHSEHIVKSQTAHQKEHFEMMTKDIKDLFALIEKDKK